MVGIISYGGFVPRYRLDRKSIFNAMGWLNPGTISYAKGEKAVANYDEDSLTMATASAMDCLKGIDRTRIDGLFFSSTTMPYKERLNAGIIATALNLNEEIRTADFSSTLRSGTTALVSAFEAAEAGRAKSILVCAADSRCGKMGTVQEMTYGDGAAAFLTGTEEVIAEFKGVHFLSCDFVDHYRGSYARFDRSWEERWIRDEGMEKISTAVIKGLLEKYDLKIADFGKVIFPCENMALHKKITKKMAIGNNQSHESLLDKIGNTGVAHPMIMLAHALETAKPGEKILVVSFGNGGEALFFEVTDKISKFEGPTGISGYLRRRCELPNYERYLVFRGLGQLDLGLRSEQDLWTRWSLLWRNRKTILGLVGNRCISCGTPHFPPQRICVNPECGAIDKMEDYPFTEKTGYIFNYTGDSLAVSLDPPDIHGQINFEGGGRFLFDFIDCNLDELKVGLPMEMTFRRKYYDERRDICGYFWKAMPIEGGGV